MRDVLRERLRRDEGPGARARPGRGARRAAGRRRRVGRRARRPGRARRRPGARQDAGAGAPRAAAPGARSRSAVDRASRRRRGPRRRRSRPGAGGLPRAPRRSRPRAGSAPASPGRSAPRLGSRRRAAARGRDLAPRARGGRAPGHRRGLRPRVTGEAPIPHRTGWPSRACLGGGAALTVAAAWPGASPQRTFVLLLLAAIATMLSRRLPDFVVGLGLVAAGSSSVWPGPPRRWPGSRPRNGSSCSPSTAWPPPRRARASSSGSGSCSSGECRTACSARRRRSSLTGLALTPLIPSATGRASLVLPLARALAEALRIPDRSGAAAVLGLAAWTGAGPLMFVALSGSGTCLLAWGLLPEASRARLGWVQWLVAALPLGAFLAAGRARPPLRAAPPRARGRPAPRAHRAPGGAPRAARPRREVAVALILALTVAGWIAAPWLHLDLASVALLGLLAAAAVGQLRQRGAPGARLGHAAVLRRRAGSRPPRRLPRARRAGRRADPAFLGESRPGPLGMVLAWRS